MTTRTSFISNAVREMPNTYGHALPAKGAIMELAGHIHDLASGVFSGQVGLPLKQVFVTTVAELEAAVAVQTAGQFIIVAPGSYQLTEGLTILLAATGGGIVGVGTVEILGAADADEAILIDPAVATATFEYTLENLKIKGGADKIGLNVANTNVDMKVMVYLKRTNLNDNGTGVALAVINTDGSNAIRIYADGPGEIDSIAATPLDNGDRLVMTGYNIEEDIVVAVVDCTATFVWKQCKLPHEGVTGGHANNVCSVINCWTEGTAFVPALPDASDFPGAFTEHIYPVS